MINKTDWKFDDIVLPEDLNRIEGNIATNELTLNTHISNMLTNPHGVTAEQLGLGNVDNTSDIDKPVSTLQKTAIDEKADTNILTKHIENTVVTTTEGVHGLRYLNTRLQVFENGKWVNVTDDTPAIQVDVTIANFLNTETEIIASKGEKVIKVTTSTNKATINLNEYGLWSFKAVVGEKETQPVELLCDTSKLYNIVLEFVSKKFSFQAPHLSQIAIYNIESENNFNFGIYKIFKTVPDTETMEFELTEYGEYKLILIPSGMTYEIIYHIVFSDKGCWYFISPRDDKPTFEQLVEIGDIIKFEYYKLIINYPTITSRFATTKTPINGKISGIIDLKNTNKNSNITSKYGDFIDIDEATTIILPAECLNLTVRSSDLELKLIPYNVYLTSIPTTGVETIYLKLDDTFIYGVRIDTTNPNPETSVTYTDDAVGMTPGWENWKDMPYFKDIAPVYAEQFDTGLVCHHLDKNDFTRHGEEIMNTSSTGEGDVMIQFPRLGYKIQTVGNFLEVKITNKQHESGYCYDAFLRGVFTYDTLYVGAYLGSVVNGKLRSVKGQTPTEVNLKEARDAAKATHFSAFPFQFQIMVMIQCLYLIVFKNLDSSNSVGNGEAWSGMTTGIADTLGMMVGERLNNTTSRKTIKLFGLENLYGFWHMWLDGIFAREGKLYQFEKHNGIPFKDMFTDFEELPSEGYYRLSTNSPANYIKKANYSDTRIGFLPADNYASETTYWCSIYRFSNNASGFTFWAYTTATTPTHNSLFSIDFRTPAYSLTNIPEIPIAARHYTRLVF